MPAISENWRGSLGSATASVEDDLLRVGTGEVERRWRWTGAGLVTVGFRHLPSRREWVGRTPAVAADWSAPGVCASGPARPSGRPHLAGSTPSGAAPQPPATPSGTARLVSLTAEVDDDEGFTTEHLRVVAVVEHPEDGLTVKLVIWAFPGAPGLRTQLWVRGRPRAGGEAPGRVDHLPVSAAGLRRRAIGHFNDTQHRNRPETAVLREETGGGGPWDWASIVCLEDDGGGVAMVKESHKCVNQPGVDTGAFLLDAGGLHNTGWGLLASDVDAEYRWCWASWLLAYEGGSLGRQSAVKRFDRLRFPPRAERDLYSLACTWGESENPRDGRDRATSGEVLAEMEATRAAGIDLLLIDDGWQVGPAAPDWHPDGGRGWRPSPQGYPDGWAPIRERAQALGLDVGLWSVAQDIPLEDMVWNWEQLGMRQLKLDFAHLGSRAALDAVERKARAFMLRTGQRCAISWDTTESAPRAGYYWAREYGNVHFMNRKPRRPANVVYVPRLALRDFWQLAHYQNLNRWQLTIHNPEVVDAGLSDAHLHSPDYCVATALMGIPLFMALPRHYSPAARERIRRLLAVHSRHRRRIFDGLVFPIGDEPSGAAWTGFQSRDAGGGGGYLTIFRERLAEASEREIPLWGVPAGTRLRLVDLLGGREWEATTGSEGAIRLRMAAPGDFRYLRYEEARD